MLEIGVDLDHPQRHVLNDEVHARPPDNLETPCAVSYLVRVPPRESGGSGQNDSTKPLADLLQRYDLDTPPADVNHFAASLGDARLRWERHTEYSRYSLVTPLAGEAFADKDKANLPDEWLQQMQGEILVGVHAAILGPADVQQDIETISARYFSGNTLIGSRIADGRAVALTDFRIGRNGISRLLLINEKMPASQAGRVMQRLLEIETYRMMALLALPIAQRLAPVLDVDERELAAIGEALVDAESQNEEALLERITRMSAGSQNRHQQSNYRFAAADAYYEIVLQRIHELREERIPGIQTFEEFTIRRLTPAVKTYRAVSKRQKSILEQMARVTKLLSTRIDIERQQQNQALLASMNRRAKAQLRLQATVEGLSVAAVTYYVVGLVGTLVDSGIALGIHLNRGLIVGGSIPIVAATIYLGVRRLRNKLSKEGLE